MGCSVIRDTGGYRDLDHTEKPGARTRSKEVATWPQNRGEWRKGRFQKGRQDVGDRAPSGKPDLPSVI
jgi:hypothetical protein